MRIRPLLWFLGLIGTLAALSIAVGSGRIIHAQVYGSPPVPPNTNTSPPPPNTAPPIQVSNVNPPAPTMTIPPQLPVVTPTPISPVATPPALTPPPVAPPPVAPPPVAPPPTTPPTIISVSGLPSTGVLSKVTKLVEQPLFELIVGVGILSALGIFFGWNARTARPRQSSISERLAMASTAIPAALPAPRARTATRPRTAGQPLPPLTARLRPLGALRERTDS